MVSFVFRCKYTDYRRTSSDGNVPNSHYNQTEDAIIDRLQVYSIRHGPSGLETFLVNGYALADP